MSEAPDASLRPVARACFPPCHPVFSAPSVRSFLAQHSSLARAVAAGPQTWSSTHVALPDGEENFVFSPDGRLAASFERHELVLWDVPGLREVRRVHVPPPPGPAARCYLCPGAWSTCSRQVRWVEASMPVRGSSQCCVATVRVADGALSRSCPMPGQHDGNQLYHGPLADRVAVTMAEAGERRLRVVDLSPRAVQPWLDCPELCCRAAWDSLAASVHGALAFEAASLQGCIWRPGSEPVLLSRPKFPECLTWAADGSMLAVVGPTDSSYLLIVASAEGRQLIVLDLFDPAVTVGPAWCLPGLLVSSNAQPDPGWDTILELYHVAACQGPPAAGSDPPRPVCQGTFGARLVVAPAVSPDQCFVAAIVQLLHGGHQLQLLRLPSRRGADLAQLQLPGLDIPTESSLPTAMKWLSCGSGVLIEHEDCNMTCVRILP